MKYIKSILLGLVILSALLCDGQNYVDLARFHYATTPQNEFDSIPGNTNIEEFGADITLPIKLNDDNAILTGFFLEQTKTKLHPLSNPIAISTVNVKVGFNRNHSEKWNGTYILLPKLSSDFKKITGKDFQIGGAILMKYKKSENFKYHLGVYANSDLHGPMITPLLGFYYKSPNDKFEANFTLPIWADVNYKIANWLNAGVNFSAITRTYNLGNDNAYVMKKSNELFGYLQFNIKKSFIIQTKTGYSLGRGYEVYDSDDNVDFDIYGITAGDNRTLLNTLADDGLIFRIRLIYRYHL